MKKFLTLLFSLAIFSVFLLPTLAHAAPMVKEITPQGLKMEIAKNKGKVVLVNFWASWCLPCGLNLDTLSKIASNNKGKVIVLLVAFDNPQDNKIATWLSRSGRNSSFLLKGNGEDADWINFFNTFDAKKATRSQIQIPLTYFYNRKGKLIKTTNTQQTFQNQQKIISPLL